MPSPFEMTFRAGHAILMSMRTSLIAHAPLDGLDCGRELVGLRAKQLDAHVRLIIGGHDEVPGLLACVREAGDARPSRYTPCGLRAAGT